MYAECIIVRQVWRRKLGEALSPRLSEEMKMKEWCARLRICAVMEILSAKKSFSRDLLLPMGLDARKVAAV